MGGDDISYITEPNLVKALGRPLEEYMPSRRARAAYFASQEIGKSRGKGATHDID